MLSKSLYHECRASSVSIHRKVKNTESLSIQIMCLKSDSMDIPQNLLVFSFLLRARKDNQCSNIVWGWGLRFVKQVDFFFFQLPHFFFHLNS